MHKPNLDSVLAVLADEICRLGEVNKAALAWFKSHVNAVTKIDLKQMEDRIMATQAEVTAQLREVIVKLNKSAGETATLQASVDALKAEIDRLTKLVEAGGEVTAELKETVNEVVRLAQVVDDNIPDPVEPPVLP